MLLPLSWLSWMLLLLLLLSLLRVARNGNRKKFQAAEAWLLAESAYGQKGKGKGELLYGFGGGHAVIFARFGPFYLRS